MPDDITLLAPLVRRMRERIRAMEQSRFWKLRNRFFALKKRWRLATDGAWPDFALPAAIERAVDGADPYAQWLRLNAPRPADLARMRELAGVLPRKPRFALLYLAPNGLGPEDAKRVPAAFESLNEQVYGDWEACLSVAGGAPPPLAARSRADPRFVVVEPPPDDPPAFAAAFAATTGDYVALLRDGDILAEEALFEVALLLNRHGDADIIYGDEDTVDAGGSLRDPYFKPEWSPDLLLSRMYLGVVFYRRSLLAAVLNAGVDPRHDPSYGIALSASEQTGRIHHLPRVLVHRQEPVGAAGEAADIGALSAALERRGEPGHIEPSPKCTGTYVARYDIVRPGRVSIIVPTRDHGADVDRCLASIFSHAGDADFEVLLVDNGSTQPASLATFADWSRREPRVRVLRDEAPFNFSALNNRAVALTTGTYVLFLNNDTEVRSGGWLHAMVEQAQRPAIAAVGAKLLFPDGSVQHAGVVLGIGGVAGHSHRLAAPQATGYFCALECVTNYSAVTAACLMVRRSVFDEAGGFDEALTVAYNDVDLCLKFRARGYRNVYLPHVVLTHAESKTRGQDSGFQKSIRAARERLLMAERWGPLLANDPYYNPNLTRRSEDYAIRVDELVL